MLVRTRGCIRKQLAPGDSWTPDTTGMGGMPKDEYPVVNLLLLLGNNWFAATQARGAYRSANAGTSWVAIDSGLPSSYYYGTTVNGFAAAGTTVYAVALDTDQIHTDIYSTTNSGIAWNKVSLQSQSWNMVSGFLSSGEHLFVAADSSVYVSSGQWRGLGTIGSWASRFLRWWNYFYRHIGPRSPYRHCFRWRVDAQTIGFWNFFRGCLYCAQ